MREAAEVGTTHLGAPRPPSALVGFAPLGAPLRYFLGPIGVFWSRKIHKKFRDVWTPFDIDFLQCKKTSKKLQLALGTMSIG